MGGADTLEGGDGNDTYYFRPGDGSDVIIDGAGGADTVILPGVMDAHNYLHFSRPATSMGDLVVTNLKNQAGGDVIRIVGFFSGNALGGGAIETFQAGGRTFTVNAGDINDLLAAMPTSLPVAGFALVPAITTTTSFRAAWGVSTKLISDIIDVSGESGGFTVNLATDSSFPALPAAAGTNLVGANNVHGGMGNDKLTGDGGANSLLGGAGNDTLEGGAGADTLAGGAGDDVVSYTADMAGVTVDLGSIAAQTGGMAAGDVLSDIEHVIGGTGGDRLTGAGGANSLLGGAGNDTLAGGAGADTLAGGAGDDYYRFGIGDRADRITDSGGGADALRIVGRSARDLSVTRDMASLVVRVLGPVVVDQVTIDNYFAGATNAVAGMGYVEAIKVGNFTLTSKLVDVLALTRLIGGATLDPADSTLPDSITTGQVWADAWQAHILDLSDQTGAISVDLTAETSSVARPGHPGIPVVRHVRGGSGGSQLFGDKQNNSLFGGAGGDRLDGRGGNDTLVGGAGDDTYLFSGLGVNRIIDSDGSESLRISGINRNRLWFTRSGDDLVVQELGGRGEVRVDGHFASSGSGRIESFQAIGLALTASDIVTLTTITTDYLAGESNFSAGLAGQRIPPDIEQNAEYRRIWRLSALPDPVRPTLPGGGGMVPDPTAGSGGGAVDLAAGFQVHGGTSAAGGVAIGTTGVDVLYGDRKANRLVGGNSADNLHGRGGDDTLSGGAGFDIIDGGMGTDFVEYTGSKAGVSVRLDQSFGYFGDADGDIYLGIEGVIGSSLSDTLVGSDGANTLAGGSGVDQLMGGTGDDMYRIGASTGAGERIEDAGGADVLFFGDDIATGRSLLERLWFEVASDDGDDLLIQILGTTDEIRIENYQNDGRIESFQTNDFVTTTDADQINNLIEAMTGLRDTRNMLGGASSVGSIRDFPNPNDVIDLMVAVGGAWDSRR